MGYPLREVYDPERDGWYEVDDSTVDYSLAALDEYKKGKKDQEPGVQLKVIDTYEGEDARPAEARRAPIERPRRLPLEEGLDAVAKGLEGTRDLSG